MTGQRFTEAWNGYWGVLADAFARAVHPAADDRIDNLAAILDDTEMDTVREAVRAERIEPEWAARVIALGCPPDRLAEAERLATATGGDRESVEAWIVAGRLDEALRGMEAGRLGEMYEEQS